MVILNYSGILILLKRQPQSTIFALFCAINSVFSTSTYACVYTYLKILDKSEVMFSAILSYLNSWKII